MTRNRRKRYLTSFALLTTALLLLFIQNINSGSVSLSPKEIFQILTGELADSSGYAIVWDIRLPRILAAAILGGALSVSGFLLQTFFSNPIAGPFVLGISSGARLFVSLVMIFFMSRGVYTGSAGMIAAAFAGSMASMGLILLLSGKMKNMSLLIICGVMIGYICSAVTDFAVTFADDANIVNLHTWSMGSFSGISWDNVAVMSAAVFPALIGSFLLSKPMEAYQLGPVYAENMGVSLGRLRIALILLSSLLSACVTAFAGPVSFVGIAVPHLVKSMLKTAKPAAIIPGCFLGGAVFCLFCDLIARTAFSPTELAISSVTALFGAPVVIFIMLRRRKYQG